MKAASSSKAGSGRSARARKLVWRRRGRWLSRFFSRLVDRFRPSETFLLTFTAILVGSLTGLAAVLFIELIDLITTASFSALPRSLPYLGRAWLIVIPALGGLLVGPIIVKFAREAKGHGVPEVMQALALRGGRIRPRVAIAKIVASSICIGTGGSAGREGPIVQVGSTLGSVLGQVLRLSEDRIRNLVACGAAAGVAATFNAPIAGVAFAIEVFAGDLGLGVFGNVVIASVTASVISQALVGSHTAFTMPEEYVLNSPTEILFYVWLGLIAAFVGIAFIKILYSSEDLFDRWKRVPDWSKPAIGGLLLGGLAYAYGPLFAMGGMNEADVATGIPALQSGAFPHIFASGFQTIEGALSGSLPWKLLLGLAVLKMLGTSLTLGSGNSGGVFAPSLFMGAMVGGAFGVGVSSVYPDIAVNSGAYALAGMAGVFAASARAPLTAILIAFEMSDDYKVILPLMATTITATLVASAVHPESIYTTKLVRRGIRLRQGRDVDVLDGVLVREIMESKPATVLSSLSAGEVQSYLIQTHHHGALVLDEEGKLAGIATLQDIDRVKEQFPASWKEQSAGEVMIRTLLTAFGDETMGTALERMASRDIGRLPVVDREDPGRVLGIIRRADIVRAYQRGLLRRENLRSRASQLRLSQESGMQFLEMRVARQSAASGKKVRELTIPANTLLTTRRRGDSLNLLHGEHILEADDVVYALAAPESAEELRRMFEGGSSP